MKRLFTLLMMSILMISCKDSNSSKDENESLNDETQEVAEVEEFDDTDTLALDITPISHATAVLEWGDSVIYTDPVGGKEAFNGQPAPDFILLTDIHGDHMNVETLNALELKDTKIVVPQAVKEKLPENLQKNLLVLKNGDSTTLSGFTIAAIPMYNLPQTQDAMHTKGRGNGYVVSRDGKKLYISGDTEDIPEMRNLKNIDVALLCMNLPYTMTVDNAADAVLDFKPRKVIPYHYRGKNGLSDIEEFKKQVNEGNSKIKVELMDWYPSQTE